MNVERTCTQRRMCIGTDKKAGLVLNKSIPTHSPSRNQRRKNVDFDTFDGHVMVNFIEPNFQESYSH